MPRGSASAAWRRDCMGNMGTMASTNTPKPLIFSGEIKCQERITTGHIIVVSQAGKQVSS